MATTDRVGPASDEPAAGTLRWETAFSLATNRFTIYDMLKMIGITWAIMLGIFGTIFTLNDGAASFWSFFLLLGIIMVGFLLMFMAIMLLFFGNRYPARFTLSSAGSLVENRSRRARLANRAAVVAGALGGRPGVAGAGLIAASQEAVSIAWTDVKRVNEHPDQRVISLMNGWRVVIRLYCTPENYAAARDFIRARAKGIA
jgi:hypothetical protein